MKRKARLWCIGLLAAAIMASCLLCCGFGGGRQEFARFEVGRDRSIVIYSEGIFSEAPHGLHVEIRADSQELVSQNGRGEYFYTAGATPTPEVTFEVITAEDGNLVGLVEPRYDVVLMYDFASDRFWPSLNESLWERFVTGKALLERLAPRPDSRLRAVKLDRYRRNWIGSDSGKRFVVETERLDLVNGDLRTRLELRLADEDERLLCLIETDLELESREWSVGWLDDSTVVFASKFTGVHAWQVNADRTYAKHSEPLLPELAAFAEELLEKQ